MDKQKYFNQLGSELAEATSTIETLIILTDWIKPAQLAKRPQEAPFYLYRLDAFIKNLNDQLQTIKEKVDIAGLELMEYREHKTE